MSLAEASRGRATMTHPNTPRLSVSSPRRHVCRVTLIVSLEAAACVFELVMSCSLFSDTSLHPDAHTGSVYANISTTRRGFSPESLVQWYIGGGGGGVVVKCRRNYRCEHASIREVWTRGFEKLHTSSVLLISSHSSSHLFNFLPSLPLPPPLTFSHSPWACEHCLSSGAKGWTRGGSAIKWVGGVSTQQFDSTPLSF